MDSRTKLKEVCFKISVQTPLTEAEALKIFHSANIPYERIYILENEVLDIVGQAIINMSGRGYNAGLIHATLAAIFHIPPSARGGEFITEGEFIIPER